VKIDFIKGDITVQKTDAIVNAANSSLLGGGGVDGAIHRAGGPLILEECKAYVAENGPLPTGRAMLTTGGNLPAKYVIHTVGPIHEENVDQRKLSIELRDCYLNSLRLAAKKGLKSVAFPSISTGAYHYPLAAAAPIAVQAAFDFLRANSAITEVRFVLYNKETYDAYIRAFAEITG
jgi:O-acetyl-ADP-ribose deacetylase